MWHQCLPNVEGPLVEEQLRRHEALRQHPGVAVSAPPQRINRRLLREGEAQALAAVHVRLQHPQRVALAAVLSCPCGNMSVSGSRSSQCLDW